MERTQDFNKIRFELQARSNPADEVCDCPIWELSKWAVAREVSGVGRLVYSPRAGGLFQPVEPALKSSDLIDGAFTVSVFNGFEIAPKISADSSLISAPSSKNEQVEALLFHIATQRKNVDFGIDLGEINPAHGHETGGYDEDPIHFQHSIYAATGCERDWEVQSIVDEAVRLSLIRTEIPEHGGFLWAALTEKGERKVRHIRRAYWPKIRQNSDELQQRTSIDIIPDTNVLLEFAMLDQIEWGALFPNIENLNIIIVPKVSEEMDGHKSGKSRLRKRALWFNRLARKIEGEVDGVAILKESDPRISISLADPVRKQELDEDQFEIDDADGRIVAETVVLMDDLSDAFFISDDTKPLRIARKAGIMWVRPLEEWRRDDPPDERDSQIAELKAQLGPQPSLSIAIAPEFNRCGSFEFDESIANKKHPAWTKTFSEELLRAHSPVSDEALRHRLRNDTAFDPLYRSRGDDIQGRIDAYHNEYHDFEEEIERFSQDFLPKSENTFFICPLRWHLQNDGTATAEEFAFQVRINGPLKFIPTSFAEMFFGETPSPPSPPEPHLGMIRPHDFGNLVSQSDPFKLDVFHEAHRDGSSTMLEWRCDQFRHGDSFSPYCFVVFEKEAKGSAAVEVRLRAKNIAKVETQNFAVRSSNSKSETDRAFFVRRLLFVDNEAFEPAQKAIDRVF